MVITPHAQFTQGAEDDFSFITYVLYVNMNIQAEQTAIKCRINKTNEQEKKVWWKIFTYIDNVRRLRSKSLFDRYAQKLQIDGIFWVIRSKLNFFCAASCFYL